MEEKRFSVSLVYHSLSTLQLRVIILNSTDKNEALKDALLHFKEEMKGYSLITQVILYVDSKEVC